MTQTADGSRAKPARRARSDSLFVLVREERGSTDIRFTGAFVGRSVTPLPDVLRQIMRRAPAFLHFDLRDVDRLDEDGIKQLTHAVRISRRHGAVVKISASASVKKAVDAAGAAAALGILSGNDWEKLSTSSHDGDTNGRRRPSSPRTSTPRY